MIAVPRRKIWTPWDRPSRPAFRPSLIHQMGRLFSSGGWVFSSGGGNFGSAAKPCCLYQARDCATNTLQSIYVKKSDFPSFPSTYYFKYSGTCYYVQSSDHAACSNTPISGQTTVSSCSDSACNPTIYQFRYCANGALAPLYTTTLSYPVLYDSDSDMCYTVSSSDVAPSGSSPLIVHGGITTCTSQICTCPSAANQASLPTACTVTGFCGNIGNCSCWPYTTNECYNGCNPGSGLAPVANLQVTLSATNDYTASYNPNRCGLTDGSCCDIASVGISCFASLPNPDAGSLAGLPGWLMIINGGPQCGGGGGDPGFTAEYAKIGPNSPLGTYQLTNQSSTCNQGAGFPTCHDMTFPATVTVS